MLILGLSALYHDAAAALLKDGELVAAAQEERFTRQKFDPRFPQHAIAYCLAEAGITSADLDYVVFYEKPLPKFERILMTALTSFPRSWQVFRESMISWFSEKLWIRSLIMRQLQVPQERILFVPHHISHAASAMFCSPFAEAAVLVVDGVGEWASVALGQATGAWQEGQVSRISLTESIPFPHSLGLFYSAFTAWLGFKVNSGEYKVMGMAPYGQPRYTDKLEKLIQLHADGSFRLDMDYFSFHYSLSQTYNQKFLDLMGPAREPESPFFTRATDSHAPAREAVANQYYADVAASVQWLTEEALLKIANRLATRTGLKNLALAGGVALNSVANGRLMRETPFTAVYIQPNAGDAGGALGAALYAWHVLLGQPRRFVMEHAAYGQGFSDAQVREFLEARQIPYDFVEDEAALAERLVADILQKKVIGFFQGRFEWGPRALGNRSIIADPRDEAMKEVVNTKIKFREPFRPFAPVVLESEAHRYFELDKAAGQYPQRFMLMVAPVAAGSQDQIQAVNHMGTGRLQTIQRDPNPLYYETVRQFGQATGTPVLLNTSFNLRGEPIVSTPAQAFQTFSQCDIDTLVLNRFLVKK